MPFVKMKMRYKMASKIKLWPIDNTANPPDDGGQQKDKNNGHNKAYCGVI